MYTKNLSFEITKINKAQLMAIYGIGEYIKFKTTQPWSGET
jgi:hypothetical protein